MQPTFPYQIALSKRYQLAAAMTSVGVALVSSTVPHDPAKASSTKDINFPLQVSVHVLVPGMEHSIIMVSGSPWREWQADWVALVGKWSREMQYFKFSWYIQFFGTAECDCSGRRYSLSRCLLNVGEILESNRMLLSDKCRLSES